MEELTPDDLAEVERVAREYTAAFRTSHAARALDVVKLPVVDCVDLGPRAGVFVMEEDEFAEHVRHHHEEDFHTDPYTLSVSSLGKNAAMAYFKAKLSKESGETGETEWVTFLARTENGWKVWANWLGPVPEGF